MIVIGKNKTDVENYIQQIDKTFWGQKLKDQDWGPERSTNNYSNTNIVAIREDIIISNFKDYNINIKGEGVKPLSSQLSAIIPLLAVHGTGHNAGADLGPGGHLGGLSIMSSGAQMDADMNNRPSYNKEEGMVWPKTDHNETVDDFLGLGNRDIAKENQNLAENKRYWKSEKNFGDRPAYVNPSMQNKIKSE